MEFLNSILENESVQQAGAAALAAAGLALAAFLRELAVRIAARMGAMHAEAAAPNVGAHGAEKMDMAIAHVEATLPAIIRPSTSRTRRLIEGVLPKARRSMAPPVPDNSGPPN